MDETRVLHVTQQEAELILDSFKVSNHLTRTLALKVAGIVLEFAAAAAVTEAGRACVRAHGADEQR